MSRLDLEYSRDLMAATNEILKGLKPGQIDGAINWGDLGCSLVEKVHAFDGREQPDIAWRVIIEEASPAAYQLASYVQIGLTGYGFKDIEVQCDW